MFVAGDADEDSQDARSGSEQTAVGGVRLHQKGWGSAKDVPPRFVFSPPILQIPNAERGQQAIEFEGGSGRRLMRSPSLISMLVHCSWGRLAVFRVRSMISGSDPVHEAAATSCACVLFNRFYARNGFCDNKPASWSKDDWQG